MSPFEDFTSDELRREIRNLSREHERDLLSMANSRNSYEISNLRDQTASIRVLIRDFGYELERRNRLGRLR